MQHTTPCILIFTRHALPLARRIAEALPGHARILAPAKALEEEAGVERYEAPTARLVGSLFQQGCPLIGIASVGLMVRLVAAHVQDKEVDPPVVAVDEGGRYVVPVLSGHVGGGNALAERIAARIGAVAVVTTATEALGTLPIDRVATEEGWQVEDVEAVKAVARCLVNGEPVVVVQECGETTWRQRFGPLPPSIDFIPRLEALPQATRYRGGVLISDRSISEPALRAVAPKCCGPR